MTPIEAFQLINETLNKDMDVEEKAKLNSMALYYNKNNNLTDKQITLIKNIADNYSEESIRWRQEFGDDKREIFNLAIKYYSNSIYFVDLCNKNFSQDNFTPTRRQYEKMCENKYFQKVLKYYRQGPRYSVSDIITFRKNETRYSQSEDAVGMIEAITKPASFLKGGCMYNIIWLNGTGPEVVVEYQIKLYRQPKSSK